MTQKAAIAKSLLKGEVLSIMNGFKWFGCTNIPREIGRSIERTFDVQVSRVQKEGLSRYEQPVSYFEYRLNRTEYNKEGIKKMIAYISEIEQQEFKSIVKRGAKTKHVKTYDQKVLVPSQPDLFSHSAEERDAWDLYMDN
jgi:hypothetical protein